MSRVELSNSPGENPKRELIQQLHDSKGNIHLGIAMVSTGIAVTMALLKQNLDPHLSEQLFGGALALTGAGSLIYKNSRETYRRLSFIAQSRGLKKKN